jgi:hypothetical protein
MAWATINGSAVVAGEKEFAKLEFISVILQPRENASAGLDDLFSNLIHIA